MGGVCRNRYQERESPYFRSFVDFVFVPLLVNEHRGGLAVLEQSGVHGEAGGQREERLLQGAAPHRTALCAHGGSLTPRGVQAEKWHEASSHFQR